MKFKAKPLEKMLDEEEYNNDWLFDLLDDDGYVTGYLVENYLVGPIVEAHEEYINFEWWIPIQVDTVVEAV